MLYFYDLFIEKFFIYLMFYSSVTLLYYVEISFDARFLEKNYFI